jgi:hypothetical protein
MVESTLRRLAGLSCSKKVAVRPNTGPALSSRSNAAVTGFVARKQVRPLTSQLGGTEVLARHDSGKPAVRLAGAGFLCAARSAPAHERFNPVPNQRPVLNRGPYTTLRLC